MDGADINRQFIKMHFKDKDPIKENCIAENIYTGNAMIFIMDPKVNPSMKIYWTLNLRLKVIVSNLDLNADSFFYYVRAIAHNL